MIKLKRTKFVLNAINLIQYISFKILSSSKARTDNLMGVFQSIKLFSDQNIGISIILNQKMRCTYRYSLNASHLSQNIAKDPMKSSHINLLNTNELSRSLVRSRGQNSDRQFLQQKKTNYKYQRVNNSFRLVQVDPIETQNKQNYCEFSKNSIEQKNNNLLLTLNSLCERVDHLQKNMTLSDKSLNHRVHQIIERILEEKNEVKQLRKYDQLQNKAKQAMHQIELVKQKIKKYQILPSYIADSEQHILKKCRTIIEEHLGQKLKKKENSVQKYPPITWKTTIQIQELKKQTQSLVSSIGKKLQSYVQSHIKTLSNQNIAVISDIIYTKAQFEEELKKLNQKIRQVCTQKMNNQVQTSSQRKKCNKQIIGNVVLELQLKSMRLDGNTETIIYGVDPEGYLVDSQGYYLVDSRNQSIKLTSVQITKLRSQGLTDIMPLNQNKSL